MSENKFDIIILGAGPGGYVAAIRAAQLGLKTALVEKEHVGGVCLNWGCIPTKALLRSADMYRQMNDAKSYGLKAENIDFDLTKIIKRSRNVSKKLAAGVKYLIKKNEVTLFEGHGKLDGPGKLVVETKDGTQELTSKHIILATGARSRELPGLEPDGNQIWNAKNAMVPRKMPKSLLVMGSGAIGVEFASFYNTFGVDVTIVELLDRIMPVEDEEVSEHMEKSLKKQGIKIMTGTMVKGAEKKAETVEITLAEGDNETKVEFDTVLSAVGIVGNVEDIGLETTRVKVDKSHVVVNKWLETDEPGIYAIGDLAGAPWLAHKASHEAVICVEKIAGVEDVHPLNPFAVPGCTYCHPQVASVGLTEANAKQIGKTVKVGRFPFSANGKAIALGETEGFVKTVFDAETGELLGAHMVGTEVTELIQGYVVAQKLETTEAELMHTVFPHPTLSEMMHESVLDAFGKAIHF